MKKLNEILKRSESEMKKYKHPYVGSEHLLLAVLLEDNDLVNGLKRYGLYYESFSNNLLDIVGVSNIDSKFVLHTGVYKRIVENVENLSGLDDKVLIKNLLLCILDESDGIACSIITCMDIDINELYNYISNYNNPSIGIELVSDLPLIGRDDVIKSIEGVLLKKDKCNPLLIGNAGVGKTAIVEELSRRLLNNEVPDKLIGYSIKSIDLGTLVAGTKYRGDFEEKLNKIIEDNKNSKTILFIDEMHNIVNAGGADGAINASDILKPFLARGDLKIIGATTINEYNNSISLDKALDRRFSLVNVEELDDDSTKDVLIKVKNVYEEYHDVVITEDNINDIVRLSSIYIHNKCNPDKSLELLDLVCSYVNSSRTSYLDNKRNLELKKQMIINNKFEKIDFSNRNKKTFDVEDILKVLSLKISTDLLSVDDKVLRLRNLLKDKLIGQDSIINKICSNIEYKLNNDSELLSLNFYGKHGVGKSLTTDIISDVLTRDKIIVDVNDYVSSDGLERLIGSQFYKKYLFQNVVNNPCSIIEINNMDCANLKIKQLFKDIFDKGYCLNYNGEKIIFNNCIFIFNYDIPNNIGFSTPIKHKKYMDVNDEIVFNDVDKNMVKKYVDNYNDIHSLKIDMSYILDNADYYKNGFIDVNKYINKFVREVMIKAQ